MLPTKIRSKEEQKRSLRWIPRGPLFLLITELLLSGCAGRRVHDVRRHLLHKSWDRVIACAGIPSQTTHLPDKKMVVQWNYQASTSAMSLPIAAFAVLATPFMAVPAAIMGGGSISIAGSGSCHAIGVVQNNHLISLRFGGDNTTVLSGRAGVCEPIFQGCHTHAHK